MKKTILLLTGVICLYGFLVGCGNNYNKTVTGDESPVQNSISGTKESSLIDNAPVADDKSQTENLNIVDAEELADTFGIFISLPENQTWIADSEYYLEDENNLRISYHDLIADADCTLLVSKNNNLNLPQNEYDEKLNESWEGYTIGGQHIVVKVQHENDDENTALATWEYNEYQFAIIGEDVNDSTPIPKVALYIINRLD